MAVSTIPLRRWQTLLETCSITPSLQPPTCLAILQTPFWVFCRQSQGSLTSFSALACPMRYPAGEQASMGLLTVLPGTIQSLCQNWMFPALRWTALVTAMPGTPGMTGEQISAAAWAICSAQQRSAGKLLSMCPVTTTLSVRSMASARTSRASRSLSTCPKRT